MAKLQARAWFSSSISPVDEKETQMQSYTEQNPSPSRAKCASFFRILIYSAKLLSVQ